MEPLNALPRVLAITIDFGVCFLRFLLPLVFCFLCLDNSVVRVCLVVGKFNKPILICISQNLVCFCFLLLLVLWLTCIVNGASEFIADALDDNKVLSRSNGMKTDRIGSGLVWC